MTFNKKYALHIADLRKRGITAKQAGSRGYEFLSRAEMQAETGIVSNAIKLLCRASDGTSLDHARYRLLDDDAIKKYGRKYHQAARTGIRQHFAKKFDRRKTTVITEGEIKADQGGDVLTEYNVVGEPGVSSHRDPNDKTKLHPDFDVLKRGAVVEICYDTDQNTKPQVWREQLWLADALRERGCKVSIVQLQDVPNAGKTGLDDYLQHYSAKQYATLPRHDLDSEYVKRWRDQLTKNADTLPSALRDLKPFDPDWFDKPAPKLEYVIHGLLQKEESGTAVGPGGAFKTTLFMQAAASIASGRPFCGLEVPKKRKVLYAMLERHEKSMRRRWHSIAHGIASEIKAIGEREQFIRDIKNNVYLKALAGETISLLGFKNGQYQINEQLVDALIDELISANIEVLILDPYSRLNNVNENDNVIGAMITKALERILMKVGCSIVLIHHTGKSERTGQYAGRGASALTDNTSECYTMQILSKEERERLDLSALRDEEQSADVVLFSHVRCSDGPRMPDMYLVRNPHTALLRQIIITSKTINTVLHEITGDSGTLTTWGADKDFTKNTFVEARRKILGKHMSIADAKQTFDKLIESGFLEQTLKDGQPYRPRGGQLYRLKNAQLLSAPAVAQTTKHLKIGGRNRAANTR